MVHIEKSEWRWVAVYATFIVVLLSVPYLVGFIVQTDAQRFSGGIIGVHDINSYLAKMNQGARGEWLFTLPYSSEPQQGAPLFLFHLILGKIGGKSFIARVLTYHLARIVFGFALTLISYRFLSEFLPQVTQRRLAIILVTLGGGLGWVLVISGNGNLFNSLPHEFASPESFSFLMLLTLPHLLAARCLLMLSLLAFLHRRPVWTGIALALVSFIQPATTIVAWAVIGAFSLFNFISAKDFSPTNAWKHIQPVLVTGLISAPSVLYFTYLFFTDPFLKQWSSQNIIPTPNIVHYISGFGIYFILALFGIKTLKQARPELWRLIAAWAILLPVLLSLPIGIQRRMNEGFQVPLVALAVLGLTTALFSYRRWLIPLCMALVLPSSLLLYGGAIQSVLRTAEPVFVSADELSAFEWLNHNAQPAQIVLCAYPTGNALPAHTALIPFIGHTAETVFLAAKEQQVAAFYQGNTNPAERMHLLDTYHIQYVIDGPHERALGSIDLAALPYLSKRFEQGSYSIFEVVP